MRDWFESLQAREQLFVGIGAVVVTIALLYGLLWRPLDARHSELSSSVNNWQRSLQELRPLRGVSLSAGAGRPAPSQAGNLTPVVIVDRTLRARGLDRALQRSQPTTANGIRVEFENVAFDDLVLWLGDLGTQYSMQVSSGSFSAAAQSGPGRVNATLTLERAL